MVRRIAAHYIYIPNKEPYKLHYIEVSEINNLNNIIPLKNEIAGTSFYNGVILVLKEDYLPEQLTSLLTQLISKSPNQYVFPILNQCQFNEVSINDSIHLYILNGIDLLSTKFRTSNSSGHCHIQRLC